ncbi:MAG: hypothetical protein KJ930_16950 [Gammaproteobacteria bacterium]|nr:hypothetical protein [Gammaproteobacteria bacterium]MBU2181112.1 hypothetical protein [Gammaproteobacteria bacterium]MBU2223505.1 hypothetical protein [Gammaproteobacteria bacterium]MBU2425529.1 hypothetical protein [Gammaproteobacteria bacterium]
MSKLTVVAISGASGCGKSAVIEHLATLLDCDYLRFDDYIDADSYPKQMRSWLDAGADPAAIQSPRLEAALLKTIAEAKHSSEAPKFLLLEEPFGRQRPQLSALIDTVVLLQVPLALCLSRVIQRNLAQDSAQSVLQIKHYLQRYDEYLHQAYQSTVAQVAGNCDLIVSDLQPSQRIAEDIAQWLQRQTL